MSLFERQIAAAREWSTAPRFSDLVRLYYKQDKDRQFLRSTGERLRDRYPTSESAARASVWRA